MPAQSQFDATDVLTGEGQPQGRVLVVGANNDMALERLAARSVDDVADSNAIAGFLLDHVVDVPDGSTASIDVTVTHKIRVIDVHLIKKGGAGGASDTIQVRNGSANISDAMSINVADQTVVRAATIDDANYTIAAGGTLRIVRTKVSAANVACEVHVKCIRRA